jgi:hypothetical protein
MIVFVLKKNNKKGEEGGKEISLAALRRRTGMKEIIEPSRPSIKWIGDLGTSPGSRHRRNRHRMSTTRAGQAPRTA